MKQKNKFFSINSTKKLAIINTLIFALIASTLYIFIPKILNYPPNSIDNDFQVQIVGIKYTDQFLILISITTVLFYLALRFIYGKLSFSSSKAPLNNATELKKLRKKCFDYPYIMFLIELFIPSIIVALLLVVFNTSPELNVRITTVIFSFSAVFAILSYMINKSFFINKLIQTAKISGNKTDGIRINLYKKLLIQILPLFLYSFVLILLISLSFMTTEKSELINSFYKTELESSFNEDKIYTIEEAKDILSTQIGYNSENDTAFIFSCDKDEVYYSPVELNNFLKEYTKLFSDKTDGHIYEYYGQNVEGAALRIHTEKGDCFVGIRYYVLPNTFIIPFISLAIVLLLFNGLFIFYIGKTYSNDIVSVVNGMSNISNSKNIIYSDSLPITSNDEISDLTEQFNKIRKLTQNHIEQLQNNQDMLVEKERLASLGQLIGGISHNLKTPIMSISGAAEGLSDLIKEYDASIGDPEVTNEDHHEIANDMRKWVEKIREYTEYMSDIITAVKGQAVTLSSDNDVDFTIDELIKRVDILMKHELKNALITLNTQINVDKNTTLDGDVNSLVQVVNNLISNAIQAYEGKTGEQINLIIDKIDNNLVIKVQDFGSGMSKEVQQKLFKEMITTKGKNGSGLGLFMSYSTIKSHFKGNLSFETEKGKGTTFTIKIPM